MKHCGCECLDQQYLITFPKEDWQILWSAGLCLFVCTSQKPHVQTSWHFLCVLAVAVAQSSSDDSAVHYVLPVLRMTSGFLIVGVMWCMARITATGCQSAVGNADGRHWSASALPVCIASRWLTSFVCKPHRMQWSLDVEVNSTLHAGVKSIALSCSCFVVFFWCCACLTSLVYSSCSSVVYRWIWHSVVFLTCLSLLRANDAHVELCWTKLHVLMSLECNLYISNARRSASQLPSFYCPLQSPASSMSLIRLLVSALFISFACLHHLLPHLSFFLHFSSLMFSFENRPAPFPCWRL